MTDKFNTILAQEKQIKRVEEKILQETQAIEQTLHHPTAHGADHSLSGSKSIRKRFIQKIARRKFLFALLIASGTVLVWRGLWEITAKLPLLSESFVALFVGLGILWVVERYSELP